MKKISMLCILAMLAATLSCAPGNRGGETVGTLTGILVGAIIGHTVGGDSSARALGTGVGMVVGGLVGSQLGRMYDQLNAEEKRVHSSIITESVQSSKVGEGHQWYNPETGHSGRVVIVKEEAYCREYQQTIVIGGKEEKAYGTACRQPDGSWKIKN